jgi:pimeloyl-ACP methyl ester carboxylesterase
MVAVLAVDSLAGLAYNTSTTVAVVVTKPPSGQVNEALVVFPGYAGPATPISHAFASHLGQQEAMIVVNYAQRGIDDEAIYRLVVGQLDLLQPQRVRILGGSMGGMVAVRFLARYAARPERTRFGRVVLVLDTAPSGPNRIRRPQWLFAVSSWYRGGPITSAIWTLISRWGDRPIPEPGADQSIIADGERENALVGTPALTTQAAYIDSFSPTEIPGIRDAVLRATYLKAQSAQHDPLVDVDASIADWTIALPNLTVTTIANRRGEWHLPWTYRPNETITVVNAA